MNDLSKLDNLNQINIFRCSSITRNKQNELKYIFGDKYNTNFI